MFRAGTPSEPSLDYGLLFHTSPTPQLVMAADPPDFTIVAATEAYYRMTNTSPQQLVGKSAWTVFPLNPEDADSAMVSQTFRSSLFAALKSKAPQQMGPFRFDIRKPPEQGGEFEQRFWTMTHRPVLDESAKVRYLVQQADDITEFVRLSEQRIELSSETERMESEVYRHAELLSRANAELARLNEKLHQADELKSAFFANISHELRTPLTLILGPVSRALEREDLADKDRQLLTGVKKNATLLLKQVNDILEISTLEAGKLEVHYSQLELAPFLRQIADNFQSLAESRGVAFSLESPETADLQADPDMLQKIMLNLLSNALKFTPAGGSVKVEAVLDEDRVRLTVGDSGPGIPLADREMIFDRFFRGDSKSHQLPSGTGLGLAIVRELAELHGGWVEVGESALGGASFSVFLPLLAPEGSTVCQLERGNSGLEAVDVLDLLGGTPELSAMSQQAGADFRDKATVTFAPELASGRPEILVVEDSQEMSAYIASCLDDYHIHQVFDGQAALAAAKASPPDLIISDVMMPGMSGPRLVRELRKMSRFNHVPIIILTARAETDLRIEMLRSGAQDFLVKPFLPEELVCRVANLIQVKKVQERLERTLHELSAARAQQIHSAKMAALGQLVAGIAHEINNPVAFALSNISSVSEWLEQLAPRIAQDLQPELLPKWERIPNRLKSASDGMERVAQLVLKLRTFSRLDEGEFKRIDVAAAVDSVLGFLGHRIGPGVTIETEYSGEDWIDAFPSGLNQVLMNVISNAIDAVADLGVVKISSRTEGTSYLISVQDTGPGLPEELMERIFDPFFTTKPVGKGTGLGLSISFAIMQAHRGKIRAFNLPDGGCEFVLEIPLDLASHLST